MSDASPHIRHRVQLPDGKHVEIVYRDHRHQPEGSGASEQSCAAQAAPTAGASDQAKHLGGQERLGIPEPLGIPSPRAVPEPVEQPDPLHVCFNCAGELVYPLDWGEEGENHWRIALRCPECEAHREGVFEQAVVERLDDELDRATSELLTDLRQITHANMTDEIEFFVRALEADLIVPNDF
jgi:hypothetical protein